MRIFACGSRAFIATPTKVANNVADTSLTFGKQPFQLGSYSYAYAHATAHAAAYVAAYTAAHAAAHTAAYTAAHTAGRPPAKTNPSYEYVLVLSQD